MAIAWPDLGQFVENAHPYGRETQELRISLLRSGGKVKAFIAENLGYTPQRLICT